MSLRRAIASGFLGAVFLVGGAIPAFAAPTSGTDDLGTLCNFGTYGDLSALCSPSTLQDAKQYCDLGTYGDFTPTCDLANLSRPGEYLNLGTYGDYSGLVD
jgi:hypothetical protein